MGTVKILPLLIIEKPWQTGFSRQWER